MYKNKSFVRFAKRAGISDAALCDAVLRAGWGQVDAATWAAALSSSVSPVRVKHTRPIRRVPRDCLFRRDDRAFFGHELAKNKRENLRA